MSKINMSKLKTSYGPMLNAYPDSMGGTLRDIVEFLEQPELRDVFESFYILPSVFNTDLDRGFSVIDYGLNNELATLEDLDRIKEQGIKLKLDFILNHISVASKEFQDLIENGKKSQYKDFFINWNDFWQGHGTMTEVGYIQPHPELIQEMFFRKEGLPILMVEMEDGSLEPYWNTFYQEIKKVGNHTEYLGQMDLNVKSPLVWEFYKNTLHKLSEYGATIVRLDAFAYGSKEVGKRNFLNDPETWEILERVKNLADEYSLTVLPEIHTTYEEKIHEKLTEKGYMTYDFFLPGLIIEAIENNNPNYLVKWANEIVEKDIHTVNMLGCHDGIPLLDLKGILREEEIQNLISIIVDRGGYVKELHGQKNMYYQVNATYYSALGEDDKKMLLARAIQLFMPGKPQIWYLDLFAGKNDNEAVVRAGAGGHKEINRTNLTLDEIKENMNREVVQKQLELIHLRNTHPVFHEEAEFLAKKTKEGFVIQWLLNEHFLRLKVNLMNCEFCLEY